MKEDQVVCNRCGGKGSLEVLYDDTLLRECPKCLGTGILDWIQNIIGKKYIDIDVDPIDFD